MAVDVLAQLFTVLDLKSPLALVINIILSTIVGGFVFLIVAEVLAKGFRDSIKPYRAFAVVFIVSIISHFNLLNLASLGGVPSMAVNVVLWIILSKLAFSSMKLSHTVIVGVIGFVVSLIAVPYLMGFVYPLVPSFG